MTKHTCGKCEAKYPGLVCPTCDPVWFRQTAMEDIARMDWLETGSTPLNIIDASQGRIIRETIDRAMNTPNDNGQRHCSPTRLVQKVKALLLEAGCMDITFASETPKRTVYILNETQIAVILE